MSLVNCNEIQQDIVRIWPVVYGMISYRLPMTVRRSVVTISELGASSASSLTEGLTYFCVDGAQELSDASYYIIEENPSIKAVSQKDIRGHTQKVTIQLKVVGRHEGLGSWLFNLCENANDLLLYDAEGNYWLVRSAKSSYICETEENREDETIVSVKFTIENINGIQRIQQ